MFKMADHAQPPNSLAVAQDFPTKPIRMVVGFPPGGGIDQLARVLAEGMSRQLGQNIVVDNKPGAGTAIASAEIMPLGSAL